MATLKDLLVSGPTRLIGRIFVNDSTLVTNLNADMVDGKHASDLTAVIKTITRTTNADHFLTFVDSNNSSLTEESLYTAAKIKFNPSTGNLVVGGYVAVGTGGVNSYLASSSASNIYLQNTSGAVLVVDANVVRRGQSVSTAQLGNTTYPWAGVYTKYVWIDSSNAGATAHINFNRANYNYIQVPTGGTLAISVNGSSGALTRLAVDASAAYPGYNNETIDLGTSTYKWRWLYTKGLRTTNYEISESTNNRLSVGNAGQSVAKGLNVGDLLVSNAWSDYTKVPTNGIYSKGQIKSGVAQGTAPMVVDSSTQVANFYAEYSQKIQPLYEKTFENYTCAANNASDGYIYFGNVVPTSSNWATPFYIYYTLSIDTSVNYCHGEYDCMVGVAGSTVTGSYFNRFYSGSYYPIYQHMLLYHDNATKYANKSTYPVKIGVRVYSAYGPNTVARTYTIKVWKLVGCTFSFPDNIEKYGSIYNNTNYCSTTAIMNATSLGLQETGDVDTTVPRCVALYYSYIKAGVNGIKMNSLIMQDSSGNWQSFTTGTGGNGTSKAKNPTAFRLGSRIYFVSRSSDLAAGSTLGGNQVRAYQELIDLRYSINITLNTSAVTTNNLEPYKPVYIVGTIGTDGYFYLVDSPWWTQTEPTTEDGKIYIRVGEAVYPDYTHSCYRADLLSDGYAYWYKDGQFQRYYQLSDKSINSNYADVLRDSDYHEYTHRRDSANLNWADGGLHYFLATSTMTTGKPSHDAHILHMSWDNGKWEGQLSLPTTGSMQWRTQNNSDSWGSWNTILDSSNYSTILNNTYVKKVGDTMTGALYINLNQDVGLDKNGSLIIGDKNGENIAIDGNEIMARNNAAAATLFLQNGGGTLDSSATTNYFRGNVGIGASSPENKLDVNGIASIYPRGEDNTLFKGSLIIKQQNSTEGSNGAWDETKPSFGIQFNRFWTSSGNPYGETACAGIFAIISSSWRGGLVFRTKNNTTSGGTHDISALTLLPSGEAKLANGATITKNTTSSTLAILELRNSSFNTAASAWASNALFSSAIAGTRAVHIVGKADSNYNSAVFGYKHAADGSTNNIAYIGLWGKDNVLNVLGSGNVGIGTETPKTKFHVSGGQAEFNSSGTGASTIITATSGLFVGPTSQRSGTAGNYSSGIGFSHMLNYSASYTNNSVQGWIGLRLTSTAGSELSALVLATKSGTGTGANDIPVERMCILPDGKVGVNIKAPTEQLDVSGITNSTSYKVKGTATIVYNASTGCLEITT